jgi:hypothetical protein
VVVEADPDTYNAPQNTIIGRGTEADTLLEAGIKEASVIVAATNDDANNLSILITAQQLNKEIMTIGRVSRESDQQLFIQARCDYLMRRSQVVANEVLTIISRPLVRRFVQYSSSLTPAATNELIGRSCQVTANTAPITWRLVIDQFKSPALANLLQGGGIVTVGQLSNNDSFHDAEAIPLLLLRGEMSHLLPDPEMPVAENDELLFCGRRGSLLLAQRLRNNTELVDSIINGNQHHIPLLRWLSRRHSV